MDIHYFTDANNFLDCTGVLLENDEARYGLILGISKRLLKNPHHYGKVAPWFCVVQEREKILAAAIRTPPHNVILSHFSGYPVAIAASLVESISKRAETIPGVIGDKMIADPFAENWCASHGTIISGRMAERIYRLEKINKITLASGNLRPATMDDKEILTKWIHSFYLDVFHAVNPERTKDEVAPLVSGKEIYLWDDGIPLSMVAKTRPTDKGISIGLVYTPPELRQRGYGTSCVAALCKELLDSGYKFCTLYADLANPISNSIYQKIGFKPVCDSVEIPFR